MAIKAWMRVLRVTLTMSSAADNGKLKQIIIGANEENGVTREGMSINGTTYNYQSSDLTISVSGDKYMSPLKDNVTIKISNLTYAQIVQIIAGQYYNLKVECGYRTGTVFTIFDGGVMYISNLREAVETNTVTILGASKLVAKWGQKRLNLSFNSGVNMYSAIKFICRVGGIPNYTISTQYKKKMLAEILNVEDENAASALDKMTDESGSMITNSDCVGESFFMTFDAAKSNCRIIKLREDNIVLTGGFPKMTSQGITLSMMPTFQFQCGDTICIDNALIQIDVQSQSDATKNFGALLDENGQYMIFEQHFELQNRGNNFYVELDCKTRSKIANLIGDNKS